MQKSSNQNNSDEADLMKNSEEQAWEIGNNKEGEREREREARFCGW